MVPIARAVRLTASAAALVAVLTACGGNSPSPSATGAPDEESAALVDKANEAMKETSFRASGSTTVSDNSTQEVVWDPEQGLSTVVRGEVDGKIYCKDGQNYLSASLMEASLKQSGQDIEVPTRLAGVYVTTDTGQGCDAFFAIPATAERDPEQDGEVDGRKTQALTAEDGRTKDVYHVAATGKPLLLKMESERDGRRSTTVYGSFGATNRITLPTAEQTMPMADFQRAVAG
ncbi:hypothetical protein QNO07_17385 [Streptomyces sp. 549]|uniref:hypothetical protein n=1 Tax=Streptomyces sp. 549 TaxID=3049076 RepID=UPI0024C25A28|nr:hypothetical protein [Streptomyces sp. 549]MDK1475167.1 hypothetical protein [Streptomyces sp. 549]